MSYTEQEAHGRVDLSLGEGAPEPTLRRLAKARLNISDDADDLDIRVLDRDTGPLIRKLVLDPTRDYQPRGVHCGNSPENKL
jgi:hypothetical protein